MRRALNFAFDFEEMNKQIFFDQYKRISSYFDGTELASSGLPQGRELEILETVRAEVPAEVFTTAYTNPVGGNPEAVRENLREGAAFAERGRLRGARPQAGRCKTGTQFALELLGEDPSFERVMLFFKPSLERLGIARQRAHRSIRRNTKTGFAAGISMSSSHPGVNRCRPETSSANFGGRSRPTWPGSRNIIGIKNPAIDKLIERVIFTKDRDDLVAATKALDRVLLWNHYVVPHGIIRRSAPRAGTASAGPTDCRNMACRASRRCGGSMPTRPPGSASGLEGFSAHGAALPPACARPRHRRAERDAVSAGGGDRRRPPKFMAFRCSAI